jgi:hypothetical protein
MSENAERKRLKEQVDELTKKNQLRESEIKILTDDIHRLKAIMKRQTEDREAVITYLNKQVDELTTENKRLMNNIQNLNETIQSCNKQYGNLFQINEERIKLLRIERIKLLETIVKLSDTLMQVADLREP